MSIYRDINMQIWYLIRIPVHKVAIMEKLFLMFVVTDQRTSRSILVLPTGCSEIYRSYVISTNDPSTWQSYTYPKPLP